jgi:hypothetical protein
MIILEDCETLHRYQLDIDYMATCRANLTTPIQYMLRKSRDTFATGEKHNTKNIMGWAKTLISSICKMVGPTCRNIAAQDYKHSAKNVMGWVKTLIIQFVKWFAPKQDDIILEMTIILAWLTSKPGSRPQGTDGAASRACEGYPADPGCTAKHSCVKVPQAPSVRFRHTSSRDRPYDDGLAG